MSNQLPPYPMIGECYQMLSVALGTKNSNRDVDRWAREGDFNWTLVPTLQNELVKRPLAEKTDESFADYVVAQLEMTSDFYLQLVKKCASDAMARADVMPLLVEQLVVPTLAGFLVNLSQGIDGPSIVDFSNPDHEPFDKVFCWLERTLGIEFQSLGQHLYPTSVGDDKNGREALKRWRKGKQKPDLVSICAIAELAVTHFPTARVMVTDLKKWLLVARALKHFEEKAKPYIDLREAVFRELLTGVRPRDIGKALSYANIEKSERLDALKKPGLMLKDRLSRTSPKQPGEKLEIEKEIHNFESMLIEHDKDGLATYYLNWMKGRWLILGGDYDTAIDYYEAAVDQALYRVGQAQKEILREGLVLAAKLQRMPLYKRLKHRALVFDMAVIDPPSKSQVTQPDELMLWANNFDLIFPSHGRFGENPSE